MIREVFDLFDSNHDGTVSTEELKTALCVSAFAIVHVREVVNCFVFPHVPTFNMIIIIMFMLRVTDVHGALSLFTHFHFFFSSLVHAFPLTFTHLLTSISSSPLSSTPFHSLSLIYSLPFLLLLSRPRISTHFHSLTHFHSFPLSFTLFHCGRYALDTQLTEEELQTLCQLIDRDGNGSIDFDEFKVC
jgi:hypothetical protein